MGKHKDKKDKHKGKKGPATAGKTQANVDAETAMQVKEIEERLQAIMAEVKSIENSIRENTIEARRAQLTCVELQPMPEDAKIYRQVGKMFILHPKAELTKSLQATNALKNVEIQQLKEAHQKLEVKMKSEANGLRELLGPEKMRQLFATSGSSSEGGVKGIGGSSGAPASNVQIPEDGFMPLWGSKSDPAANDTNKADEADDTRPDDAANATKAVGDEGCTAGTG